MTRRLYSYWRSSSAYRVRIALHLKGLEFETVPVSLVADGGEHRKPAYRARNPQMLLPFLEDGDVALGQSMAILEYLEEAYPDVPLLPPDAATRARVRAFTGIITADIQPLNNLRVLGYLDNVLGLDKAARDAWYAHWVAAGFDALESLARRARDEGPCTFGATPTFADVCLVPQLYNARRFDVPLDDYPRLLEIDAALNELDAFRQAAPEAQPDKP